MQSMYNNTFVEAVWFVSDNATEQPSTILYVQQRFREFNNWQQRGQL